jgi:hypothetical protein
MSRTSVFVPDEVDAFSVLAEEMGFDRGELLTSLLLVLFVEGEADLAVLNGLFRPELYAAGVGLIPIGGAVRAARKGIADSETLLRFTSVRVAVLFDNLERAGTARLLVDAQYRREAKEAGSTELRAMAEVIKVAIEYERSVQPLALEAPDIFDLLDEDLLQQQFPRFPGHARARAASRGAKDGWKRYYSAHYGIDLLRHPELFGEIAREMRARQTPQDPRLAILLDDILRTARGATPVLAPPISRQAGSQ